MNYITVDICHEFECIANVCPNTCCVGWQIPIDRKTYEKVVENEDQLGVSAKDWIKEKDGVAMANFDNKGCRMLNENNICNVVLRLGPEYLSDVCAMYPRTIRLYGDVCEAYLCRSCPHVVAILIRICCTYQYYRYYTRSS